MRTVNKNVFNRWELSRGRRPVLRHVGRVSGRSFETPLQPRPVDGGYVFILMYGAESSDWVKNVMVAGEATLTFDGAEHRLVNPRIAVGDHGWAQVSDSDDRPPGFLNVTEILRMDCATGCPPSLAAETTSDPSAA
ncbi:MAG: nitroreductase family deazaflavin-dependent oxidoreductase [Actinomycetota bacterium]